MSLPAVSKHLRVLERAGLVARRRDGRRWNCRLVPAPMAGAASWLEDYRRLWEGQVDKLENYLAATRNQESAQWLSSDRPPPPSGSTGSSRRSRHGSSRRGPPPKG